MASRKKRKRDRRRAEATAQDLELRGGWGEGLPVSRGDLLLVRKAIRHGWPVPEVVREAVIDDICKIFDHDLQEIGDEDSYRLAVAAIRCVVKMEGDNQEREFKMLPRFWATDTPR